MTPHQTAIGIGLAGSNLPAIKRSFKDLGLRLTWMSNEEALFEQILSRELSGVVVFLPLSSGEVSALVSRLRKEWRDLPIVIAGPPDDVLPAVAAMKAGADDYVLASNSEGIARGFRHALDTRAGVLPAPGSTPPATETRASILGESPIMRELRSQIVKIARSAASTILLQGESGTGKDLLARVVHGESPRAAAPFLAINCSAIPDGLLESELFGHEAGAFTDARSTKPGLFEIGDRGTVFLDEVAELGLGLQAKLLRFLEDRSFKRLGGTRDIDVDLRIIAATNMDLPTAVAERRFRKDLYFRLQIVPIEVPPLRERKDDIPTLAEHFLAYYSRRSRKHFEGFHPDAIRRLVDHSWPGNIRELKNSIERVTLLEDGPVVLPQMLLIGDRIGEPPAPSAQLPETEEPTLRELEIRALASALKKSRGNHSRAARLLGISRDALRYRVAKYGVHVEAQVHVDPDR